RVGRRRVRLCGPVHLARREPTAERLAERAAHGADRVGALPPGRRMSAPPQVDDPAALAELTTAFAAYERALVGNDIAALNAMFWDSPLTLRYGTRAHELLYSHAEIADFREKRGAVDQRRTLRNTRIVTFGT